MKLTTLLAFFTLSSQALAAGPIETFETISNFSVYGLRCVTRPHWNREAPTTTTELNDEGTQTFKPVFTNDRNKLILQHKVARTEGCDIQLLAEIQEKAMMNFGFVLDAPTKIVRKSSAPRVLDGRCVYNLEETVTVNLYDKLELSSSTGQVLPSTDC